MINMNARKKACIMSVVLLCIVTAGLWAGGNREAQTEPQEHFGSFVIGNPKGDVVFEFFGDYQCRYCAQLNREVEHELFELLTEDSGVTILVTPVAYLGDESVVSGAAALAVAQDRKFLAYNEALYAQQDGVQNGVYTPELLVEIAEQVGADPQVVTAGLEDERYSIAVEENTTRAKDLGVSGLPTVMVYYEIDGQRYYEKIQGVQPLEFYTDLLEKVRELKNG